MELVKGVNLHFIPSQKFKTNRIMMRFSEPISEKTIAGRALAASMIATANRIFPTSQSFREKLATLYGAEFFTSVSKQGCLHYVDIHISFARDNFLSRKGTLTEEIFNFLKASLFYPLTNEEGFDSATFDIEKKNLLLELASEKESQFTYAHQESDKNFFEDSRLQLSKIGRVDLIQKETAITSYLTFEKMLQTNRVDCFFLGDFNQEDVYSRLSTFPFKERDSQFTLQYQQKFSNIVSEHFEKKEMTQSILELGYHISADLCDNNPLALLVLNGLLGAYGHSKLFVNLREKESLAYTIVSHADVFTGLLRIYAGIDRENRVKTFSLINKQLSDIRKGKFTIEEFRKTKQMVRNSFLLSLDQQESLIERCYLEDRLQKKYSSVDSWMQSLESVTREDIVKAAQQVRLQSIYFLEGIL